MSRRRSRAPSGPPRPDVLAALEEQRRKALVDEVPEAPTEAAVSTLQRAGFVYDAQRNRWFPAVLGATKPNLRSSNASATVQRPLLKFSLIAALTRRAVGSCTPRSVSDALRLHWLQHASVSNVSQTPSQCFGMDAMVQAGLPTSTFAAVLDGYLAQFTCPADLAAPLKLIRRFKLPEGFGVKVGVRVSSSFVTVAYSGAAELPGSAISFSLSLRSAVTHFTPSDVWCMDSRDALVALGGCASAPRDARAYSVVSTTAGVAGTRCVASWRTSSDVLAVCFSSDAVVLYGTRAGELGVVDIRCPAAEPSVVAALPTSVSYVRAVRNSYWAIAADVDTSLRVYDVRSWREPLHSMPAYHNTYKRWPLLLDDSPGHDPVLMAACATWASGVCKHPLHAWNVCSGQSLAMHDCSFTELAAPIRSMAACSDPNTHKMVLPFASEGCIGILR